MTSPLRSPAFAAVLPGNAVTTSANPVIAFFLMVQGRLSSGLVGGAVKG